MDHKIKELISNLKHVPGVYLMYDKDKQVIYIGKAKDLQKRVSQYFLRPQVGKVMKMVSNVNYFETIITKNEKEAFVLEMNLIQKYYPKYNILLKDGSHYPYIALKRSGDPRVIIKRQRKDNKYLYFGPYPHSQAAYQMVDLLNKIFPLRKCVTLPKQACLYYHLGQCLAPCINHVEENKYQELRNQVHRFLKGDNLSILHDYEKRMYEASNNLEYEKANEYKKIIDAINHLNASQNVEIKDKKDIDIFAYSIREGYLALTILLYRQGVLLGKENYVIERFDEEEEQIAHLISQFYTRVELPSTVVINNQGVIDRLTEILETSFINITRGPLFELVTTAKENANNALDEYFLSSRLDDNKLMLLEELGTLLKINTPLQIDLFDNSHLQGSSPVGAMVSFINGERAPKLYRKFKIEHEEKRDDLESMKEIIYRHYLRSQKEHKKLPDLILVDGGLTQIRAAKQIINDLKLKVPLFGLFKNDKHQTEGLMDQNGQTYKIENKALFFLLTRMQDEVHRFAISYHKEKRNKAMTVSLFDNIKGLGSKRQEDLLRVYQDLNELKNASIEELSQILPDEVAKSLFNKLHD